MEHEPNQALMIDRARFTLQNLAPVCIGSVGASAQNLLRTLTTYCSVLEAYEYIHQQTLILVSTGQLPPAQLSHVEQQGVEITNKWEYVFNEIILIPQESLDRFFLVEKALESFRIMINRMRIETPIQLSQQAARLLGHLNFQSRNPKAWYDALVRTDMNYGKITIHNLRISIRRTNLSRLLINPEQDIRRSTYLHYYKQFNAHKHTLSEIYRTTVQHHVMLTRIQGYSSTCQRVLNQDRGTEMVHDNLIATIHEHVSAFHEYFALRKQLLQKTKISPYDLFVPLIQQSGFAHTYEQAVTLICESVTHLGSEYGTRLREGLLETWFDRDASNERRLPGSYTVTSYLGGPHILMNYAHDVPQSLFTLAHESGHAMHSWYSIQNNSFSHYEYSILEAETVAAVHEELLIEHMMNQQGTRELQAYLLDRRLQGMILKLLRQTLLSEFEHRVFQQEECGNPLTMQDMRNLYRSLLENYYGPDVQWLKVSDLEWLTVDHLFHPYYMYTYPVGFAAAQSLTSHMLADQPYSAKQYLNFLKSGGSLTPSESLAQAGVDISTKHPYDRVMEHFRKTLHQFRTLAIELKLL